MAKSILMPTWEEMIWKQCRTMLMLNPLAMNTYYTQLFEAFKGLFSAFGSEDYEILVKKIAEVESWLSDEYNKLTLYEAELRMFNNMDLLSGFVVNGVLITQFDIQTRLEEIKKWLNERLFVYMPHIRFVQEFKL